ncbi:MAG TPA: esterase, partial [Planctomycetota bacterium]|nr:esterase [Planctomycetota bacterium]
KIDDLAFIDELLVEVARRHPVDEKRIFATGISNGGFFSHWLAAHRSEKIAAIAPVAGGMAPVLAESFRPAKPVSVLVIQGTEDPIVPYGGGELKYGRGKTIPTLDAVRLWAKHDRCGGARDDEVQDMDPNDGTTTLRTAWRDGQDGTDVILYTVKGGGHTWPGGSQYLPVSVIGRVSRDFSATEMIWGFFAGHPKR